MKAIVNKVKNFLSGGTPRETTPLDIDLVKAEITDIVNRIDDHEETYQEMREATANQLEKGESRNHLESRLEEKYLSTKADLLKSLGAKKAELRGLEKGKQVMSFADSVVRDNQGRILMLLRCADDEFEPNKWGLAGGKIEAGETPQEACVRELKEETDLDAKSCYKIGTKSLPNGGMITYYSVYVGDTTDFIGLDAEEHCNYCFMSLEEIKRRPASDFIMDSKNTILQMLDPMYDAMQNIKKGHESGMISDDQMEKAIGKFNSFAFEQE